MCKSPKFNLDWQYFSIRLVSRPWSSERFGLEWIPFSHGWIESQTHGQDLSLISLSTFTQVYVLQEVGLVAIFEDTTILFSASTVQTWNAQDNSSIKDFDQSKNLISVFIKVHWDKQRLCKPLLVPEQESNSNRVWVHVHGKLELNFCTFLIPT